MGFLSRLFGKKKVSDRSKRSARKNRARKYPEYFRLHAWIESRIGSLSSRKSDEQLRKDLQKLLKDEERRLPKNEVTGLKAYIETNSYRKMLEQ